VTQFDTIFAALQTTGVRYVVVGGVAVNLHGYQRFTKDHLISMKRNANRPQDLLDIEQLEKIKQFLDE